MDFLKKIQNLPESKRRLILWTIVIILSLVLLFFWGKNSQERIKSFKMEGFKRELELPVFEFPSIEFPSLEEIKELENTNEQAQ